MCSGILSYSLTEAFHLPGTGSLIITAFMLAHYGWYYFIFIINYNYIKLY